ncbi:hypothetical protein K474DRAFT_1776142 [Panus rudis PR-1116 ss-1]|nr:hypothetical protein K474DRAFT_1776142 [Panus rudis PR-1116 ss-1]
MEGTTTVATPITTTSVPAQTSQVQDKPISEGPLPMSFPALLRNGGLNDRFAHLRISEGRGATGLSASSSGRLGPKKNRREEKEARFVGNPHIVTASKKDYAIPHPTSRSTFPEPLPVYLSRNNSIPASQPPTREPISANAGRFSMSLKGMRRELRRSGPRTEVLVKEVEDEITSWLRHGGVLLKPDAVVQLLDAPGSPIGTLGVINEVERTPLQLVWSIADDAFARYVVHCCARYHNIVSFSKESTGRRLTYLLRPNVTRPDFLAPSSLDTPPATDDSELSAFEYASESDFVSDRASDAGVDSDIEGAPPPVRKGPLSDIAESLPGSPALRPEITSAAKDSDDWSVVGDSDADAELDELVEGADLASSVGSLSLDESGQIPLVDTAGVRPSPLRARLWDRQRRSASSPSRSPARRPPPRPYARSDPLVSAVHPSTRKSFYEYLFA